MATVNYQLEQISPPSIVVTWPNMANGDVGQVLPNTAAYTLAAVALSGTPGTGLQVNVEQAYSPDNPVFVRTTQYSHTDVPGNFAVQTAQNLGLARPNVVAGDGTTDVTVTFVLSPITFEIGA